MFCRDTSKDLEEELLYVVYNLQIVRLYGMMLILMTNRFICKCYYVFLNNLCH